MIAFDFAFMKTTSASGETEQKDATTLFAVDADLFFVKVIPVLGKETTDYSATGLIKFIEGFFHKHVRLWCDWRAGYGGSGKQSEKTWREIL